MTTAMLLWALKVEQDPSHPIDTLAFTDAPITHPLDFKVKFIPRIRDVKHVIETDASA